jgi:hypothetical protein
MVSSAYQKAGAAIEEATTELLARRATRDLVGIEWAKLPEASPLRPPVRKTLPGIIDRARATAWTSVGSYNGRLNRLFAAYERALGAPIVTDAQMADALRRLEDASVAMRSRPPIGRYADRRKVAKFLVDDFVDQPALGLDRSQRSRFRKELRRGLDKLDDVAVPEPVAQPRATSSVKQFARDFAEDLETAAKFDDTTKEGLDARSRIRNRLRQRLAEYGMQTKTDYPMYASAFDDYKKKPGFHLQPVHSYRVEMHNEPASLRGYMDPRTAVIKVHPEVWENAQRAMRRVGQNPRAFTQGLRLSEPGKNWYYNEIANDTRTFFHEEIHGTSAMLNNAYDKIGIGIEEATTETAARRVTRDFFGIKPQELHFRSGLRPPSKRSLGYWDCTGSYPQRVRRLFAAYERALGTPIRTEAQWLSMVDEIEEASINMRTRPAIGEGSRRSYKPSDIVDDFVEQPALKLNKAQRAKLRKDLLNNALDSYDDDFEFGIIEE